MFLALTDHETAIVDATRDTIEAEAPLARWFLPQTDPRTDEDRVLAFGAGMGWNGFAAPAEIGGADASIVEEMLVFRSLGRNLAPIGFTAAAMAVHVATAAGLAELAAQIVSGQLRVALSSGESSRVLGANGAELVLAIANDVLELRRIPVPADVHIAFDGMTTVAAMPADARVVSSVEDERLILRYRLIVAAQLQAAAETALWESNAYAKTREQFGRLIGSFQAIRHRIADMEVRARQAEAQVGFAAVRLQEGAPDAGLQVNIALLLAQRAAQENAEANIGNHGAIGVTTENTGHLLLKRAALWSQVIPPGNALLDLVADAAPPAI